MSRLLTTIAGRLGMGRTGVTEIVTPNPLAADIDSALGRRRAARAAEAEAHERAHATLRAKKIAADPIMRSRALIMERR